MRHMLLRAVLFVWATACAVAPAHALTAEQVQAMTIGDSDDRAAAMAQVAASGDAAALPFFRALQADRVKTVGDKVVIVDGDKARDAASGADVPVPADVEDVINSNRIRNAIDGAMASLRLASPDAKSRAAAVREMRDGFDETKLPLIERALASESEPSIKTELALLRATVLVTSGTVAQRQASAKLLADSPTPSTRALILDRLKPDAETDPAVRSQLQQTVSSIDAHLAWGERLGVVFTGVSLGSILLLVALGLAITYGLMGVINMAHGELMMIGAYATWLVQDAFKAWLPGAFGWYMLIAIPASFLAAALVGAVLERGVIRWLYGRPLETLLATWGISLVLQQTVRSLFGAQNVQVENPNWLSGGVDVMSNLTLPFNRIAIIAFAALVLAGVSLLIARTRLGLFVRGVTQNRPMAACMGVNTARIDTYAFALGSGIAGLAGCALSQVGNVGPDLGQSYIVDSFLVVVLGGVGQLAGTVYAALGLGVLNKILEGWTGAVLAKIMVLLFIVVFIQKRPQGIFAMKGRSAEA